MEVILQSISNLGFPIALSVYLLVRLEGKMEELTGSIHELTSAIRGGEPPM
ncbi:MAG: YvrJ family protein [Tissierellia bacterium]|nr:YvrJ family protein [Tissierellia bacterium]